MFAHNFKYALKTLFKNKMLIFWTFAFPILLGTFFHMAFSNIEDSEKLSIISIAVVENEKFQNEVLWKETIASLSDETMENQLFHTQYVKEDEARKLLQDEKITGYLILKDTPEVVVTHSGISETVFKYAIEEITQTEHILESQIKDSLNENPLGVENLELYIANTTQNVLQKLEDNHLKTKNISNSHLSYTMIEYYTLIAMACLYGGVLGMVAINQNLANMSANGKRVSVSPVKKGSLLLSSVLASYVTQLIGISLLFLYTIFVLHVDYGSQMLLVVFLAMIGCLAGLSLGIGVSSLLKTNENVKSGVLLSFTMLGCFLSGMMGITMKYVVDKNVPILNKLNPANMITDGFYSLYYYDTLDRYYFNIVSLLVFSVVLLLTSMYFLRRQKYDSI